MIKGCQKNIIHLKDTGSPYFEEAYFIVKRGSDIEALGDDIIKEATNIVENSVRTAKSRSFIQKQAKGRVFFFGLSSASLIFGIVMLIYTLAVS